MSTVANHCINCGTALGGGQFCPTCGHGVLRTMGDVGYSQQATAGPMDPVSGVFLSGWWRRVGATCIDALVLLIPNFIVQAVTHSYLTRFLVIGIVSLTYITACLTSSSGQTVGNRAVSTAVRSGATGERISVGSAVLRWLFQHIASLITLTILSNKLADVSLWIRQNTVNGQLPTYRPNWVLHDSVEILIGFGILAAFWLLDYLWCLGDKRKRTLHDRIAGTIVVKL